MTRQMPLNKMLCADCGHSGVEMRTNLQCPKCGSEKYAKIFPKRLTTGENNKAGQATILHIQETKEQIKELKKEKW